jgi:hypothetical protein
VSFEIATSQEVSDEVNRLHGRKYLGEIEFRSWLPIGRWAHSASYGQEDEVRRSKIHNYLDLIAQDSEALIKRVFPEPRIAKGKRLPMLLDLRLESSQTEFGDEKVGKFGFFKWGRSLGVAELDFDGYSNGSTFVSLGDAFADALPSVSLVTLSKGPLSGDEDGHLHWVKSALLPVLALRHFMYQASRAVGNLRVKAYRRVTRAGRFSRFRTDLRLQGQLHVQRLLVDRLKMERKANPGVLAHYCGLLQELKSVRVPNFDLFKDLIANLDFQEKNISEHAQLSTTLFKSYVEARNLEVSYRLSRRILWWTVIVTFATLSATLATFDQSVAQFTRLRVAISSKAESVVRHRR